MSKKLIERMGMEAKSAAGNVPCTFIVGNANFGNWTLMEKLAKKLKGEFKMQESNLFLQMTNNMSRLGQGFTTGCSSLTYANKANEVTIGICSSMYGIDLKPTTVVAIPMNYKYEFVKLTKMLEELSIRLPRLKKNSAWTIGSNGNSTFKLKITLDSIVNDHNKEILSTIENFYKDPSPYLEMGLPPFRKLCFAGPPGTGKTITAHALAKHLLDNHKIPAIYIGGSSMFGCDFDLIKMGINSITKLKKPALMIVEEFDSFCANPGNRSKILNFLDGFETPDLKYPLCLIMTTNHPEKIDPAIIDRSGRVNRVFWFKGIKTQREASKIINVYRGNLELPEISDLLVGKTPDFVKELIIELKWRKADKNELSKSYIADVIDKLGSGTSKITDENEEGVCSYIG